MKLSEGGTTMTDQDEQDLEYEVPTLTVLGTVGELLWDSGWERVELRTH